MAAASEAFAAGWKAKSKGRGKGSGPKDKDGNKKSSMPTPAADDPRKKHSVCSACEKKGHWAGDPECERVQQGVDAQH
eukprot:871925-Heterocapsa_arctica.AAC.1